MKFLLLFVLVCLRAASAQTASAPSLPALPDDAVIAEFDDGTRFTMGDFRRFYAVLSPAQQQVALQDRMKFLQQWAFFRKLTRMAVEDKLDQRSPYKEVLEQQRMQILSEAKIADAINQVVVQPAQIVNAYENQKIRFAQVKVKAIYIAFGGSEPAGGGRKPLTESQALAKAKKLVADIRAGADFVKLVKENSDDETSRAKGGDFDTLRYTDNIPDAFRSAVFALKPGEVTEPLLQPNGYYLLRAEEVTYRPLSEVRDEIYSELKNALAKEWLERLNRETSVKVVNPAFMGEKK
jgi:peptidyl-prolyl cis-trans isomerase C